MNKGNSGAWSRLRRSWILSIVIYALVIAVAQWPLVRAPLTSLAMGPTNSPVVPLFNLWTYWWNADRLLHGFQGYWDSPIFYPVADTFAFSEPQPTSLIVAPVLWITGSRILSYNVYFWLSWLLNGLVAEKLLRQRGTPILMSRLGGIAIILLPALQWNRDVIQMIPVWGILWVWSVCERMSRRASWRLGIELGVAAAITSLMCMHYGLFVAILGLPAGWFLVSQWRRAKTWGSWLLGGVVSATIAGPVIWYVHQVIAQQHFDRPDALVRSLSLLPGDYTAAWGVSVIPWGLMASRPPDWLMSPGLIKSVIAGVAILFGLTCRRSRRWTAFLGLTAAAAFMLSMGKNLVWGNWSIWDQLSRVVPGLSQVRSPYRFANFFQIAVVLLACEGLRLMAAMDKVWRIRVSIWHPVSMWDRIRRHAGRMAAFVLAVVMAFEVLPPKLRVWDSSEIKLGRDWVEFVKQKADRSQGILCLPFAKGSQLAQFDLTAKWMYLGTFHGMPLVNGYSGFFPEEECELRGEFQDESPTVDRLLSLHRDGVEFVVVSTIFLEHPLPTSKDRLQIEKVFTDRGGVEVFRLSEPVP